MDIATCRMTRMAMPLALALGAAALAPRAAAEIDVVPRPAEAVEKDGAYSVPAGKQLAEVVKFSTDASVPKEGYRLAVAKDGVSVAAGDEAGRFYALQTLRQLAKDVDGKTVVPCVEIKDSPRFPYRGAHLDVSRHFFDKECVKRFLDAMAYHKLNRFHWHLTDNQGWRLPVAKYPKLTEGQAAYTEEDIREVVAYAAKLHIEIVPEFDVPGHSAAVVRALPQLRCENPKAKKGKRAPKAPGGIRSTLCLGNDESLRFVEDVVDASCRLFPGKLVHIGGDEVSRPGWPLCAKCKARMAKEHVDSEQAYQAWFTKRISDYIAKKGRRAIGWDEIVYKGTVPEGAVVMSWRGKEGGIAAANAGRDCVMCPTSHCYFDYTQGLKDDAREYFGKVKRGMVVTLERAYSFDPLDGIPADKASRVLGGQFNNWTEKTAKEADLQWKVWPRGCALAEALWSPAEGRDFADFKRRMAVHRQRLVDMGINCATME